jgi:hypothetical protein
MGDAEFARLYLAGWALDRIAEALEPSVGRRLSRPAISQRARALGLPPRRLNHAELVPRNLTPAQHQNRLRYLLEAESRARQLEAMGITRDHLSTQDRGKIAALRGLLYDGAILVRVIVYNRATVDGFSIAPAGPGDTDILRIAAPLVNGHELAQEQD